MSLWTPDPTFYPSPRDAAAAPAETLAYVVAFDRAAQKPDALAVLDIDPASVVVRAGGRLDRHAVPRRRAAPLRLEHALVRALPVRAAPALRAPLPGRARAALVPDHDPGHQGPDPRQPPVVKVLEAEELAKRAGYSRPHTVHCGPEGST